MIFKCKNCSGNVVYSPSKGTMYCPYCDSTGSEELNTDAQGVKFCANCGGELQLGEYTSASKCPYCDSNIIFDERVKGEYLPKWIVPFKMDKEEVKKKLRDKFKSSIFAPADFFSDAKLDSMEGMYVPFWLYDYQVDGHYDGECTKVRSWTSGDRRYTETSVYHVVREMEVAFDKIPVDSSFAMPDSTMDLMEPYDYRSMQEFKVDYMSGFGAERYNQDAPTMEARARVKAQNDANAMLQSSITGYSSKGVARVNTINARCEQSEYALMPVWIYNYKYKGQDYKFHINGQTGKIVGKLPIVPARVIGYGATMFGLIFAGLLMANYLVLML